jgi:hypothetical protein
MIKLKAKGKLSAEKHRALEEDLNEPNLSILLPRSCKANFMEHVLLN